MAGTLHMMPLYSSSRVFFTISGTLSRVFLHVGGHHLHPGLDRREADPLSPHHSSLAHGQSDLLSQIREVVEADEAPTASHQRTRVSSPGAARADVLKLPARVADMVGHGLLQPDFDIVGVVAPNGILYQVSQVPLALLLRVVARCLKTIITKTVRESPE